MNQTLEENSVLFTRTVNGQDIDILSWPFPDEGALIADVRTQYLARKDAVKMFLLGATDASIKKNTGIGLKQTYRLIRERCLQTHPDGMPYGWRGLIPNARIQLYQRTKKIQVDRFGLGAAGAMQSILNKHPQLRRAFEKRILQSASNTQLAEAKKPRRIHWKWFLNELRGLGYEVRNEWPFNTANMAYLSVCRYIDNVLAANPRAAAGVIGGPDLQRKLISGDGVDRPIERLMQRVEMDAHKLDGRFCVSIPQVTGGHIEKIIHRLWVIVILEITSRVVLGYYLTFGKEVSKHDVLRAIKQALSKWVRREISFSDISYQEEAGFPSSINDDYVGLCWDETSVDGALAETCPHVSTELKDLVKSELLDPKTSFSKRRSKDDRPFIETFFRKLGSQGFQRLTNTTGPNPKGKQGRNPDQIALTSQFQYEYAEELLDVLIANYNATPHTSLGHRSPLKYFEFCMHRQSNVHRRAAPETVQSLTSFRKRCIVKGGVHEGRSPYVNFEGARYSNEILANRFDLVGSKIWVMSHFENDWRVAKSSTLGGQSLGILRAAPPWHKLPHSHAVRRAINSCLRRRMFFIESGADGVETFINFVESQPNNKLPVHPAYLEARRILVSEAEYSIGRSMLASAKEREGKKIRQENVSDPIKTSPGLRQNPYKEHTADFLPPHRMTAND